MSMLERPDYIITNEGTDETAIDETRSRHPGARWWLMGRATKNKLRAAAPDVKIKKVKFAILPEPEFSLEEITSVSL